MPDLVGDGEAVEVDVVNGRLITATTTYQLPPLPDFAADVIRAGGIVRYVRENGRFPGE